MTEDKPYKVYMHINMINGKMYVGQTKLDLKTRFGKEGHNYKRCTIFWNAIQKYGWDNFYHIVLKSDLTSDEADEFEKACIIKYHTYSNKYGYNAEMGGKDNIKYTSRCRTGKCKKVKNVVKKKQSSPKIKKVRKIRIRNTVPITVPDDLYSWRDNRGEPPSKVVSIRDTLYNKTYVVYGYTAVEKLIGLKENHIKCWQDNMKLYQGRFIITTVTLGN